MPKLVVGYTELVGCRLKTAKAFLKPNFGVGPNFVFAKYRAEQSHEATRVRERGMRKFNSVGQAQRFVAVHASVSNLFNLGRHLVRAEHYRNLRISAFSERGTAVA